MNGQYDTQHCKKYVSWSAIFVGALVGIGITVLLNLFSIAIGLSAFTVSTEGMLVLAVGGFIGVLLGVVAAMFTAGFTAGYIARGCEVNDCVGVVHGFAAWCVGLVLTVLIAAQVGQYVSAYGRFIAHPAAVMMNVNSESIDISVEKDRQPKESQAAMTAEAQKVANIIGKGAFIVFILFFVGAFSSSVGGYFGMKCREKCASR